MRIRDLYNQIFIRLIGDELKRKHVAVALYNLQAVINYLLFRKQRYFDPFGFASGKPKNIFLCKEHYRANSFYGIAPSLKKYANYKGKICACIEHGLYLGDYANPREVLSSGLPSVITFSQMRVERIRKYSDVPVIPIGPYIQYVESYYTEKEEQIIKQNFGKTLLVFPEHSSIEASVEFGREDFFKKVEKIKDRDRFKTVIVNLYYRDFDRNFINECEKRGYLFACAGHQNDPLFLSRLKSIINISDYTISMSVGTQVGYCISLKKPHAILGKSNLTYKIDDNANYERDNDRIFIEKTFSENGGKITSEQTEVCNYYWGLNIKYSDIEMKSIFSNCEKLFDENH